MKSGEVWLNVTIEVRARYALTQNAWYVASAGLVGA
jgi:hypothetical protein